jgi:gamma-glutamylputrescine oxidase
MEKFDTFAGVSHIRLPVGAWLGNQMMAVGMRYYQMLVRLR